MKEIVIGTRGSELALWQADFITSQLKRVTDLPIKIKIKVCVTCFEFSFFNKVWSRV